MRTPEFIYKVASREIYDASLAAGSFTGQPIDIKDGYIHFSTAAFGSPWRCMPSRWLLCTCASGALIGISWKLGPPSREICVST